MSTSISAFFQRQAALYHLDLVTTTRAYRRRRFSAMTAAPEHRGHKRNRPLEFPLQVRVCYDSCNCDAAFSPEMPGAWAATATSSYSQLDDDIELISVVSQS